MRPFRLCVLWILLLLPLALTAQERLAGIEVEPLVGDYTALTGHQIQDSNIKGLNLGLMFADRFGLEVNYSRLVMPGKDGDLYSLRGVYSFLPGRKAVPFLMAGLGESSMPDKSSFLFEYGAGVKYSLNSLFGVRADIRNVITGDDTFKSSIVYTVGVTLQIGGIPRQPRVVELTADADGDSVRDSIDYCWNTPPSSAYWKMVVDTRGCPVDEDKNGVPDYKDDADGDGVINYNDACAGTPKGWPVDVKGCPKDSDGDAIPDGKEMEFGTDPYKADTDGDGLSDYDEIYKYHTDPLKKDTDGDGLSDYDEIFVYHTDPLKADSDSDGFKDGEEVLTYKTDPNVTGDVIPKIFGEKAIFFTLNQFSIRKDAKPVLDEVAQFLTQYATANLHIVGSTCNLGPDSYNLKLSLKRANAAKDYLVKKGIPADRISTAGKGENDPKYDNKTKDGREKNRRDDITVK
jgi:outer membrane protein OmpA-like peptidoglycan-associated protein